MKERIIFLVLIMITSTLLFADFSKTEAISIILNEVVNEQLEQINVFVDYNIVSSENYELTSYKSLANPYSQSWLFFIDDNPRYNWEHSCRYVFIDVVSGNYQIISETTPKLNYEYNLEEVSIAVPLPESNYSDELPNSERTRTPDAHKWAVFISGHTQLHYWNDMSHLYCALTLEENGRSYNYSDDNIIVLSWDGGIDPNHHPYESFYGPLDPSDHLDDACTRITISNTFTDLAEQLGPEDMLFIYITDHGGWQLGTSLHSIMVYDGNGGIEPFYDEELALLLNPINCAQMIIVMQQCYSGGFIPELEAPNRLIYSSTSYDWYSTGGHDDHNHPAHNFDEFSYFWITAVRQFHPVDWYAPWSIYEMTGQHNYFENIYELADFDPDISQTHPDLDPNIGNSDGIIQLGEAFQYAKAMDAFVEDFYIFENDGRNEYPQSSNGSAFIEDVYSLNGISGQIVNSQDIQGNFHICGDLQITSGTTLTIQSGSFIFLNNDSEIIVDEYSTLIIEEGVNFCCSEGSTIKVEQGGSIVAIGTESDPILFTSSEEEPWIGIELWESEESHFRYCYIENAETGVLLWYANNGTFMHNEINDCNIGLLAKGDVYGTRDIEWNEFNNNKTGIFLYNIGCQLLDTQLNIDHNIIVGDEGDGIYVYSCGSELHIQDNAITNNKYGIRLEYSDGCELLGSESDDYPIEENDVGVSFYRSTGYMRGLSICNNEDYGVMFLSDSHPIIQSNKIINNGTKELYCNYGHPVMADGHNDIVHTSAGYLGYLYRDNVRSINCRYNWWGSDPPDSDKFNPAGDAYFKYDPWDLSSNNPIMGTNIGENSYARIVYNNALELEENEDYSSASVLYRNVIYTYPSSEEALLSLRRLFICENNTSGNMYELKLYYEELANSCPLDTVFCLISRNLAIDCDKENELFENVFLQYDNILESPIDVVDSIFTQINIMNTLLELEGLGRNTVCFDNLPENIRRLNPTDVKDFHNRSQDLLDNLFGEANQEEEPPIEIIPDYITLNRNCPNPFNPTTTISFSIPNESIVDLSIFNIKGQKVKSLAKESFESGNHFVIWNGDDESGKSVSSGVYFYKLSVNGKSKSVKKCLMLK